MLNSDSKINLYVDQDSFSQKLALKIADFDGPLDLLLYLIAKHKIDIYDIPITELTDQYMTFLQEAKNLDLESATDFLLMAATLTQIKSRMLLPLDKIDEDEEYIDPRNDLVLRLLQYKRCKQLALNLQTRYETYALSIERQAMSKQALGIKDKKQELSDEQVSLAKLQAAIANMVKRNGEMYQDLSEKLQYILSREKISLKKRLLKIWDKVKNNGILNFSTLLGKSGKEERITYFLALLELIRRQMVLVEQKNFASDIRVVQNQNAELKQLDIEEGLDEYI